MGGLTQSEIYFNEAPIAVMVMDGSGKIINGNEKFNELMGSNSISTPEDWTKLFNPNQKLPVLSSITNERQLANIELANGIRCSITLKKTGEDVVICSLQRINASTSTMEELRATTKKLRLFVEQAPAAVAMFDTKMNYISCSQMWIDDWLSVFKKTTRKKIIGQNHYELFDDITDEWKAAHKRAINGETLSNNRDFFINAKGEKVWLKWEARPWYLNKGEIGGIMLFTEIITQNVETEVALKSSEEFNRRLIEFSPIAIVIQDGQGKLLYTNPAARTFIGASSENQVLGRRSIEFMDSHYHEIVNERIKNIMKTGEPAPPLEIKFNRLDGGVKIGMSKIIPFEYNKEPAILAVINDITDISEAKNKLQASEARLRQIIDLVPLHIFAKDDKGNILMANKSFADFWNTTTDYIENNHNIPKSPQLNGRIVAKYESDDQEVIKQQKPKTTPIEAITDKNGNTSYFQTTKVPYVGDSPLGMKVLGIAADITERIKYEEDLKSLTDDLIKSNNELQQFAYITSHDLRAPLVNLKTLLGFYHKSLIHEDNAELFEKIEDSVNRLDRSLNDLVDVVALNKSKSEENVKVSFKKVTNDVLQNVNQEIKTRNAVINTDFSNVKSINYPLTHVKSILQNLITNALKYQKPKTPPHITISSKKVNGYVCIEVTDNGLGIDLKKHGDKLFGMYQRFHTVNNSKGLGLYIVKSQVEAMGGHIEVKSSVRKGTTFAVHLQPQ